MITSLVEPGGARPGDATRRVVIMTMFAYTVVAAVFAGAASIGAGLAVLALGMLFTLLIDLRQWRDIVDHDSRHAPPEPPRVALPPQEKRPAIAAPTQAPMKAITTTRLLPYAPVQERVAPEPAVVAVAVDPVAEVAPRPAAKPASKVRRQSKTPKPA